MTQVASRDFYEWPMHNDTATCEECGAEIDVPPFDDPNGDMKPPHWRRDERFDPFDDVFEALCDDCFASEIAEEIEKKEGSA